ncbi:MAG: DNA repair protein RadA [Acidimicrobiales bacterium]
MAQPLHRCSDCGATSARWAGRCPHCEAWNSMVVDTPPPASASPGRRLGAAARSATFGSGGGTRSGALGAGQPGAGALGGAVPIGLVDSALAERRPTGVGELDRVLGGGLVAGSVTLLGGEPGIGKSTLLLQALGSIARSGARCLLVSAEESAAQVRMRAERLDRLHDNLWLVAEADLERVAHAVVEVSPQVLVIDSIQTVALAEVGSPAGSVSQVRECAAALTALARDRGMACLLVGHVTKDGDLAGPRVLEHLVDTVLSFEGDRHMSLRVLRARKHRFGPTTEVGLFEMAGHGLAGVPDAGALFLADRQPGTAGSVVAAALDGRRPLLVEVQALVAPTSLPLPRRSAQGIDAGRMAMVVAVLHQRAGLNLSGQDIYTLAAGGLRVGEPAADLAVACALASAQADRPVAAGVVVCGELGLGGELRQVSNLAQRLCEAARMGFTHALVPANSGEMPPGITALRATTLIEALAAAGLVAGRSRPAH